MAKAECTTVKDNHTGSQHAGQEVSNAQETGSFTDSVRNYYERVDGTRVCGVIVSIKGC